MWALNILWHSEWEAGSRFPECDAVSLVLKFQWGIVRSIWRKESLRMPYDPSKRPYLPNDTMLTPQESWILKQNHFELETHVFECVLYTSCWWVGCGRPWIRYLAAKEACLLRWTHKTPDSHRNTGSLTSWHQRSLVLWILKWPIDSQPLPKIVVWYFTKRFPCRRIIIYQAR